MQLTFLEAAVPLTKTYRLLPDQSYQSSSYPNVERVTSHTEEIANLADFRDALNQHAAKGHCLYSGTLERPLVDESRAGLTEETDREWIMLDLDGVDGFDSVEDFVQEALPAAFHNCSYIEQHSPSSGIKPGIRVHLFFKLYMPVNPKMVRAWLQYTNLETESLSNKITLSKNARGLRYPLDIVVNDNARIVYITAPECEGFDDPISSRIYLREKENEVLTFNFASLSTPLLKQKFRDTVEDLRVAQGLPKTSRNSVVYKEVYDREVVIDKYVEQTRITESLADNERFMRCNLDGGDSFAYYYFRDQKNPYLHNFKGEPSARVSLLDPDFYNRVVIPDYQAIAEKNNRPFVFRDVVTDKYYQGIRKETEIVEQPHVVGSTDKIEDFFLDRSNTSPPDPIPSFNRVFNPTMELQWMPEERKFNFWRPTEYMENALYRSNMPPIIDKVLRHVTGDDEESYDRFLNWLAYIFQTRKKAGTAWVLHGVPGTGKGVLYNFIIRPVFGEDYCQTKQVRDLRANFNGWMEHAIFVNIDETNTEDAGREESAVVEALKMWITDPIVSVEAKHQNARMAENYTNFIFTSNDHGALPIQDGDRRFNVAPRQERSIVLTTAELDSIRSELQHFAGFLSGYSVNEALVTKPLDNSAKEELREAARTSIDEFVTAAAEGDLEYFIQGTEETTREYQEKEVFRAAAARWVEDAQAGRPSMVTNEQLKAAYITICGDKPMKTVRFKKMMAHRGFSSARRASSRGDRWYGWSINWTVDAETARELKIHLSAVPNVENIEEKIKMEASGE